MRNGLKQPPIGTPINFNHPLSKGLICCYLLNEGGGQQAINSANKARNGVLSNGAVFNIRQRGSCGAFLTDSDVVVCSCPAFSAQMTVSAWFLALNFSAFRGIVWSNYWYLAYDTINRIDNYIQDSLGGGHQSGFPTGLAFDTWYHVALTYDGATQAIYINGVQRSTLSWTGAIASSNVFTIGNEPAFSTYLNGYVQDVHLYDRALSHQEIRQLYANPYQMFK